VRHVLRSLSFCNILRRHISETVGDCLQQLQQTPEACMMTCASLSAASAPSQPLALSMPLSALLPSSSPSPAKPEQQHHQLTLTLIPAAFDERTARINVARMHEILSSTVVTPSSSLYSALSANSVPHISIDASSPPAFTSITEIHSWKFGSAPPAASACVSSIRLSSPNPPPPFRRIRGDLFYLDVALPDAAVVAITASTSGFCVRQADEPLAAAVHDAAPAHAFHSSIASCLSAANARFKSSFARIVAERFKRDPCELLPSATCCQTSWLVPPAAKQCVHIDSQLLSDSIVSQRDWNEDVYALLAMPSEDLIARDRNIIKTHVEFMEAARAVAVAAVDGTLAPVNPHEDVQSHIYIANNLFASRCVDNFDAAVRCAPDALHRSLYFLTRMSAILPKKLQHLLSDRATCRVLLRASAPPP
jgi:hypothetical protein